METAILKRPPGFHLLAGYYFLLRGVVTILLVLLTSLFLKGYGPAGLPWFYIGSNILFIGSQILMLKVPSWKGHRFLFDLSRPLILFSVVLAFLGSDGIGVLPTFALLVTAVYDLHSTQAFNDMSGQILPLREAKIHLSTVYAAGTAGAILSGLGLKFLLDGVGIPATFLLIALLQLLADRLLVRLTPFMSGENASPAVPQAIPGSENLFSWPSATRALSYLAIPMVFLANFGRILTEFLYTGNLALFFPSTRELASFLGIIGAANDLSVFGMQTFIGSQVFARFRLGSIIGFRSVAMGFACVAAFLLPNIWTITGAWFTCMALTKALATPAFVIVIEPLPKARRFLLRRLMTMGNAMANILAGLLLLYLKSLGFGADPLLFVGVGIVFALIWILSRYIDRRYAGVVGETLSTAAGQGDLDIIKTVRFIPRADRIARLSALLGNPDPDTRYRAILEAAELAPQDVADLLLVAMGAEEDPRNLSALTRVILQRLGPEGIDVIEDLLRNDSNVRLQADIIEALSQVGGRKTPEIFVRFLEHGNHRVRGNAIFGVLRHGRERTQIAQALELLRRMLESREPLERATAAVVMGNLGLSGFVPALAYLADDSREEVTRQAFHALSGMRTPAALRAINERRGKEGKAGELAEAAWQKTSARSGNRLARLLAGLSVAVRGKIGFWIRSMKSDRDFQLLTRILCLPDNHDREALIAALGNGDLRTRELIDQSIVAERGEGQNGFADLETVRVDDGPLLAAYRENGMKDLPPWTELARPLLGPRHAGFAQFVQDALKTLWKQAVIVHRAEEWGSASAGQADTVFAQRFRTVVHLAALTTQDPAEMLDALDKSTTTDSFLHSIALEFLEERLGKDLAGLLFPLLERKKSPETLFAGARDRCGFDPETLSRDTIEAELKGIA